MSAIQFKCLPDDDGFKNGEMLFKTNIVAYVGKGNKMDLSTNKVVLHDCIKGSAFGELEFSSEVMNVKLRKDLVVVATTNKILVFKLQNLS